MGLADRVLAQSIFVWPSSDVYVCECFQKRETIVLCTGILRAVCDKDFDILVSCACDKTN